MKPISAKGRKNFLVYCLFPFPLFPFPNTHCPICRKHFLNWYNFGTSGDDILVIDKGNQVVFARGGNDLIDATASLGNNRLYGGIGDDTFILGQGDAVFGEDGSVGEASPSETRFFAKSGGGNTLTGGKGADQFWIASDKIPDSANIVTDFTIGEDVIGIAGIGASFDTLTFTQQEKNVLISFQGNNLAVLNGIETSNLNADSFVFV